MQSRYYLGLGSRGFHRLHYTEWGVPGDALPVICVHGLTRNGRDFDHLAQALADKAQVVCPDVVGRGLSAWAADPSTYGFPQYQADMAALIARLGADRVDWVGTSMGGLVGMMLAAQPGSPIRRLVMNDVGPFLPKAALERIGTYVGYSPGFASLAAAEAYFRDVHRPFGLLSDEQWQHLTRHSVRPVEGGYAVAYDPHIGDAFRSADPIEDVDLWAVWDAVACPVLVLRGAVSDLLSADVAAAMACRGPQAQVVEIEGVGHAPALMAPDQIALVRDWLAET